MRQSKFCGELWIKVFFGQCMRSSPGKLFSIYTVWYQQQHPDEHSDYCHHTVKENGNEVWKPPTKRELYALEVKGRPAKAYLREMGHEHPYMVRELHADHRSPTPRRAITMSDAELDSILYYQTEIAI